MTTYTSMVPPPYESNNENNDSSITLQSLQLPNYYEIFEDKNYKIKMPPKYFESEWYENEKEFKEFKGAQYIYEEVYFLSLPSLIILILVNCAFFIFFILWFMLFVVKNEDSIILLLFYVTPKTMLYIIIVLIPIMVLFIFFSFCFQQLIYTPTCAMVIFYSTAAVYSYFGFLVKQYLVHGKVEVFYDTLVVTLLTISLGILSTIYYTILYLDHKVLLKYLERKSKLRHDILMIFNFKDDESLVQV